MRLSKIQNQYIYNDKYQKEHIKRIVIKFNDQTERDMKILEHLETLRKDRSIQSYIKEAIEEKMNR